MNNNSAVEPNVHHEYVAVGPCAVSASQIPQVWFLLRAPSKSPLKHQPGACHVVPHEEGCFISLSAFFSGYYFTQHCVPLTLKTRGGLVDVKGYMDYKAIHFYQQQKTLLRLRWSIDENYRRIISCLKPR